MIRIALLIVGALLSVYGLFAILYNGDGGGPTYVTWAGHRLDADLAGAIALLVGVALLSGAALLRRRRRASPKTS
jgi:hypothetical protein